MEKTAISAYHAIAKVPTISAGRFGNAPSSATITFKQRCLATGDFESYQLTTDLNSDKTDNLCRLVGSPVPVGKNSIFISPSGNKQISLRINPTDSKQQYLLYWNANRLEHSIDLKAIDLHELVSEKPPFHAATWSADERYFFYLAEKKQAKTRSYFDQKQKAADKEDDKTVAGNEYKYVEDWGEQLTGISKTVIGIFDSFTSTISVSDYDGGDGRCITKLLCSPTDEDQLFAVIHHTEPFRLGLVYCTQRRSDLVRITGWRNGDTLKVTNVSSLDGDLAVLDVCVSQDGKRVAWLQCTAGGPHNRAFELWTSETCKLEPRQVTSVKTCPLYFNTQNVFARNCWLNDRSIVIQANVQSRTLVLTVDVDSSIVREVKIDAAKCPMASFQLLDVAKGYLLVCESSFAAAPAILVGIEADAGDKFSFQRFSLFQLEDISLENEITWLLKTTSFSSHDCQYIFAFPKKPSRSTKFPVIVIPHGGPHSVITTSFLEGAAGLVLAGFAVILPNYPGSLAFDSLNDLPGKIGILDTGAVHHCVNECLSQNDEKLDKSNVFLYGGSHGGYITLRLIADHPDFYRAAACRNPVSDLVQMAGVTDIPDWVLVESGLDPSLRGFVNVPDIAKDQVLVKMNEQSPAKFVNRIKCPLLMAVGKNDRRVPMSQGLNFCRMLRQSNPEVPIEIYMYDDNHSLNSVKVFSDVFVNVAKWFDRYRKN